MVIFLKKTGVTFSTQNNFVRALSYVMKAPEFDVDRFKQKAKAHAAIMEKQRNVENYIDLIEKVYNRQCRKEDKLPLAFIAKHGASIRQKSFGRKGFSYVK